MTRPDRRQQRALRRIDPLDAPRCDWCDAEPATTVVTIDHGAHTAVVALGPVCIGRVNALRLRIQADAVVVATTKLASP